jgi:PAS domain S-box-containing protein
MNTLRRQVTLRVLIGALLVLGVGLGVALVRAVLAAQSLDAWNQEYITWYSSEIETELWRLIATMDRFAAGDPDVDAAAVDRRLTVLWNRLAVFDAGAPRARLQRVAASPDPLDALKAALKANERLLRGLSPGDATGYAPIRKALTATAPAIKQMTMRVQLFETRGAIASVQNLKSTFVLAAALIVALLLVGAGLVAFLIVEVGVRRRLLDAMVASEEQARLARARSDAVLIESNRRFRAIAEANPVAVLVCDATGGAIQYANPAASSLLRLPVEGGNPARVGDILRQRGDTDLVSEAGARGMVDHFETQLRRPDGSEIPVTASARLTDYDGRSSLIVGIVDLTERQAAQAEILRQREIIHQREKLGALGSLLAEVAHELNNPLSTVVAQATMLQELASDPKSAARGDKIRAAAERCAHIVKTFLDMARQRPPVRGTVDMNRAVRSAVELLAYGLRTAGIEVRLNLADPLPSIWADDEQIAQVLTNLIVNAQQALADREGARRLTIATGLDTRGMVRLSVSDNGPGIPPEIKSRIFEPFFTTKPMGVGTGIGLSICHGIVTSCGGTIVAQDAPGGGAAIVLRLPIGGGGQAADASAADVPAGGGRRVLVVDDESEVAETLGEILEHAGFLVDLADSGQSALERIATTDYDAILSDVRMARMDGLALFRRIREVRPDLARRFVIVTGDALSATVSSFLVETSRPCIEKPFIPADIVRLVAAIAIGADSQTQPAA